MIRKLKLHYLGIRIFSYDEMYNLMLINSIISLNEENYDFIDYCYRNFFNLTQAYDSEKESCINFFKGNECLFILDIKNDILFYNIEQHRLMTISNIFFDIDDCIKYFFKHLYNLNPKNIDSYNKHFIKYKKVYYI